MCRAVVQASAIHRSLAMHLGAKECKKGVNRMITIKETTKADIPNVQRLWADGDVMQFVGFPEGLQETDEAMQAWFRQLVQNRPADNHYSIFEDGTYCGEASYSLDREYGSASLDIKLFGYARGRGVATQALSYAMEAAFRHGATTVWVDPHPTNAKAIALYERLGFQVKEMPVHVIAAGEDPAAYVYMELSRP